ncbi:MAG: threonine--tRNA ligase, partial [Nitrospira sp.]
FILRTFGFADFEVYLSTRPEKFVGAEENWMVATAGLEAALKGRGVAYRIDPGEGVFYGPKIDIKIKDVLGRSWQCSTVQVDFNNPERFGLSYVGADGKAHQPIMIHRALMGSIERFFGILIEHYAGAFPTWLAPVQAVVLNITDKHRDYAQWLVGQLTAAGYRAEADLRNEKIGLKIRESEKAKIPYMLVVGDREMQENTASVRGRSSVSLGTLAVPALLDLLKADVDKAVPTQSPLSREVSYRP